MYRFAHHVTGEGTPRGRDFASRWQYPGFRWSFRVMTVVWGLAAQPPGAENAPLA